MLGRRRPALSHGLAVRAYRAAHEGSIGRFGLVYVDYPTQRRIPKRSALWYRDLIAAATMAV